MRGKRRGFFKSCFNRTPIRSLTQKVDWNRWNIERFNRKELGIVLHEVLSDTEDFVKDRAKQLNPTLIVQVTLSFFWLVLLVAAFGLYHFHPATLVPIFILQSFIVFLMFTPLHDSAHFIAHRKRTKNEIMMWLCWPIFLGNPLMFRRIHIAHHQRTNDPHMDPDHFTAAPNLPLQLLKSFGLIFYYHVYALKYFRTLRWRAHITISVAVPALLIYMALTTPFTWSILLGWVLPAFVGIGLLAFANTSWPHAPAKETNKFKNTRNTYVPWLVQLVMLNQNLHHVHHLKPNLPWYQYPEYWKEHKEEILREGAEVKVLTRRAEAYALIPERFVTERLGRAYRQLREAIETTLRG